MVTARRVLLGCGAPRSTNAGMATTVLSEGAALAELGWDVSYVFAPDQPILPARIDRQLNYLRVAGAARRLKPDVAVISSADGVLLPLTARDIPLVVQSHGLEHMHREACVAAGVQLDHFGWGHRHVREPAVERAMRSAAAVAVKSGAEASYLTDILRVPAHRVHVIPNGVEPLFFETVPAQTSTPTVVWIGGWIPRKGIHDLPRTLGMLVEQVPTATLHLVGTGAPEIEVRRWFPHELQRNLRVTPRTDRAGVARACSEAWVGLATSHFEGFGKMIIEMMAGGLPVVSSPTGIGPDVISDGETGFLVDHDPQRIAAAITGLLRSADDRGTMGRTARQVAGNYRWDDIGRRWDDVLAAVVDERKPRAIQARRGTDRTCVRERNVAPWFSDASITAGLPGWIKPYLLYARVRGRDGHRALMMSQRIARRLGRERIGSLNLDGTAVTVDLFDTRFVWVIGEVRSASLQRSMIEHYLRTGDIFIDAGANHGSFSLHAARIVGADGEVHAFEPNPFLADLIVRSAEENSFECVNVHRAALSSEPGTATLVLGTNSGSNHLGSRASSSASTTVEITTLDLAVRALPEGRRVLLKVDIEGHELGCLVGASELIARRRPVMILELNPTALARAGTSPAEVVSLLVDYGYRHFSTDPATFHCIGPDDIDLDRLQDLVAIPAEATPLLCTPR